MHVWAVRVVNRTSFVCFCACSVLRSALKGAFQEVFINSKAATGTIALTSVTPVNVSLNLGGITTLLVDAPAGNTQRRRGRGSPLRKAASTLRIHSNVLH
jgi:hypothetical protein